MTGQPYLDSPFDQRVSDDVHAPGSTSDSAGLRSYLRAILAQLVDLHVQGKHADAQFVGVKSATLHLHFDGVVESALEAIENIAERIRSLDSHSERNARSRVDGHDRPSHVAATSGATAVDAANAAANLICRIVTVRAAIGAVHSRIEDEDPSTAVLLRRINVALENRAVTLQNLSVDA